MEGVNDVTQMGLFSKYCEMCGIKLDKSQDFVRFGKDFCSEEHANKYASEMEQRRLVTPLQEDNGGC
jgi:hypothetical protein